jgi:plastocyanin
MSRHRLAPRLLFLACAASLVATACDDTDPERFDHEIRVQVDSFFPKNIVVGVGSRVRWVNVQRKDQGTARSVTSGTGPDDTDAGVLFDAVVDGFETGEIEGDEFIHRFTDIGTFSYFSRLPEGEEFGGTVVVQGQ